MGSSGTMESCQRGVGRMSSRGTMFAVLLGAIGLIISGVSVAPTTAVDNKPPRAQAGALGDIVSDAQRKFISDYCARCHNEVRKVANLDLTSLAYDPADAGNFATWVKIHDRVTAGAMPPEDAKQQPDAARRAAFVAALADTCATSEKRRLGGEGRATQRRMNRFEYENALRDL